MEAAGLLLSQIKDIIVLVIFNYRVSFYKSPLSEA